MKSLLNYPGSKRRIASWLISHMPPHHSYLEPFFGGGAVLFEKSPARIETINDLDGNVVNFFRVIREQETRERLKEWISLTPYSREVYDSTFQNEPQDPIERAGYFAIQAMQSHGFRLSEKQSWKKDVYGREAAYALKNWIKFPEYLVEMAIRLKYVQIENRPALEVIRAFNHENVLIYADPPYVMETRGRKQYRYEMTDVNHEELLETLCKSQAMVMLSGYDNSLYDTYLKNWNRDEIEVRTHNQQRRTEVLWMNF